MPERIGGRRPLRPPQTASASGALEVVVPPYAARDRLDAFLTRHVGGRSRSEWERLIERGAVTMNGRIKKPSDRVLAGARVAIEPVAAQVQPRPAANIPLRVLYEDPAMIVVDKPPGLVVHPAPGHEEGTLVNAVLGHFPELQDPTGTQRPGIVHRLDKDTSGLIVIGRTAAAVAHLQAQFRERTVDKRYVLMVLGDLGEDAAAIDAPIARDRRDRKRMATSHAGRESRTEFRVLERFGRFTLIEADLRSGRTHQLRVHFQFIGHPVAGDRTYGSGKGPPGLRRQFVHAASLRIRSPHDDVERTFEAPLPPDLAEVVDRLRRVRDGLVERAAPSAERTTVSAERDAADLPVAPRR